MARGIELLPSAIFRLFGLFRYGHWPGTNVQRAVSAELQLALQGTECHRLLATLAYVPDALFDAIRLQPPHGLDYVAASSEAAANKSGRSEDASWVHDHDRIPGIRDDRVDWCMARQRCAVRGVRSSSRCLPDRQPDLAIVLCTKRTASRFGHSMACCPDLHVCVRGGSIFPRPIGCRGIFDACWDGGVTRFRSRLGGVRWDDRFFWECWGLVAATRTHL